MKDILGLIYPNTGMPIEKGHFVTVDGWKGIVDRVILPGTKEAKEYYCDESGGILVGFEKFGLTLIPFGNACQIRHSDSKQDLT